MRPRSFLIPKMNVLKEEFSNLDDTHCSPKLSRKLTQAKEKKVRAKIRKTYWLFDSLRKRGMVRNVKRTDSAQGGEERMHKKLVVDVQESSYWITIVVNARVVCYAKLEVSDLCLTTESARNNWENRYEFIKKGRE